MFASLLLVLFFSNFADAFGFFHSYTKDRPLTVYPGEVKDAQIILTTGTENKDMTIKAELLENGGIASIENSEYKISPGKDAVVNIKLSAPKNATIGSEYTIKIKFSEISSEKKPENKGTVDLKKGLVVSLKPRVIERLKEEKPGFNWIILGIVFIVFATIVLVVWFVLKNRRNRDSKSLNS